MPGLEQREVRNSSVRTGSAKLSNEWAVHDLAKVATDSTPPHKTVFRPTRDQKLA